MSFRRLLGLGCVALTVVAAIACGKDEEFYNPPDEDVGANDASTSSREAAVVDHFQTPITYPPSSVAMGDGFGCVVAADHTAWCWGRNDFGQIGIDPAATPTCGFFPCQPLPQQIKTSTGVLGDVIAIAAGKDFACAVDIGKRTYCWGNNAKNQINGRNGLQQRFTAALVAEGTAQVTAAGQHACILDEFGYLHCWGENTCDIFGLPDGGFTNDVNLATQPMRHISLGPDALCGVSQAAGQVYCWGADHKGSLGHPVDPNAPTCAGGLPYDPIAKRWVADKSGLFVTGAVEVATGSGVTCIRKEDGTTLCAGDNSHGGLGQGVPDSDLHYVPMEVPALKSGSLSVNGETACATTAQSILCWGDARYGQMDSLGTDAGPANALCGTPCRSLGYVIPNLNPARSVSVGAGSVAVLMQDHALWVWGKNDSTEVGVSYSDGQNVNCAAGSKCIPSPRKLTTLPTLD